VQIECDAAGGRAPCWPAGPRCCAGPAAASALRAAGPPPRAADAAPAIAALQARPPASRWSTRRWWRCRARATWLWAPGSTPPSPRSWCWSA
jgi:hypothetical protein